MTYRKGIYVKNRNQLSTLNSGSDGNEARQLGSQALFVDNRYLMYFTVVQAESS